MVQVPRPARIPDLWSIAAAWAVHPARTGQPRHTATAVTSPGVQPSVVRTSRSTGSSPGAAHAASRPHSPGAAATPAFCGGDSPVMALG